MASQQTSSSRAMAQVLSLRVACQDPEVYMLQWLAERSSPAQVCQAWRASDVCSFFASSEAGLQRKDRASGVADPEPGTSATEGSRISRLGDLLMLGSLLMLLQQATAPCFHFDLSGKPGTWTT